MRVDWILPVKGAKTRINFDQILNQLKVDETA
jgi:hypothetical protein